MGCPQHRSRAPRTRPARPLPFGSHCVLLDILHDVPERKLGVSLRPHPVRGPDRLGVFHPRDVVTSEASVGQEGLAGDVEIRRWIMSASDTVPTSGDSTISSALWATTLCGGNPLFHESFRRGFREVVTQMNERQLVEHSLLFPVELHDLRPWSASSRSPGGSANRPRYPRPDRSRPPPDRSRPVARQDSAAHRASSCGRHSVWAASSSCTATLSARGGGGRKLGRRIRQVGAQFHGIRIPDLATSGKSTWLWQTRQPLCSNTMRPRWIVSLRLGGRGDGRHTRRRLKVVIRLTPLPQVGGHAVNRQRLEFSSTPLPGR